MKTKEITIGIMFSSLYVVIGYFIPFIAFGQFQCRIQDCLYALIPLFGLPSVIGLTIGSMIYNSYGFITGFALGPLDLLSPFIFVIPKLLIWKNGLKALPVHIVFIALWVGSLLYLEYGLPLQMGIISVGIGETIAESLGVPLYYVFDKITNQDLGSP